MSRKRGLKLAVKRGAARALSRLELGRKIVHSKQLWPYLEEIGWFKSRAAGVPLAGDGRHLPWLTYPAIWFLDRRLPRDLKVFEYGSGSSTVWWGERVSRVVSCEHDPAWFDAMRGKLPPTVEYLFRGLDDDPSYQEAVSGFEEEFHVVVIDGRRRTACAENALGALRSDGVLIWDDTHRPRYGAGCSYIQSRGFRRLDFEGMSPLSACRGCTSIFYRPSNCFDL